MPRIRTIKPNFWEHEDVAKLPAYARLLFIASWNFADDEGRLRWNPAWLARVFPYDLERGDITFADIREWMALLEHYGMVQSYVADDGQQYGWIVKFLHHQVVPKATASRLPAPPPRGVEPIEPSENPRSNVTPLKVVEDSGSAPVVLQESSGVGSRKKEVGSNNPPPSSGGAGGVALAVQPPLMAEVPEPPAPAKARGSRLPEDWTPSLAAQEWSRQWSAQHPGLNVTEEWARFRDYWLSTPGAKACKLDWDRTWKNWLRTAAERLPRWKQQAAEPAPKTNSQKRRQEGLALLAEIQAREAAERSASNSRRAIQA